MQVLGVRKWTVGLKRVVLGGGGGSLRGSVEVGRGGSSRVLDGSN